jgi:type IV secretory pathway component VirB8
MIRFFSTIKSVICKLREVVRILVKLVISPPKRIYWCLSIAIGLINTKLILSPVNLSPLESKEILLERYQSHTKNCAVCQGALKNINRLRG